MCSVYENEAPRSYEVFSSAARTATPTAVEIQNTGNFNTVQFLLSCTADPAAASVTPSIETYDDKAGVWFTLLTGAAFASVSEVVLEVGSAANVANVSTVFHPGKRLRVNMTHADSDSITYSVTALLLRR